MGGYGDEKPITGCERDRKRTLFSRLARFAMKREKSDNPRDNPRSDMAKEPKNLVKEGMGRLKKKAAAVKSALETVAADLTFTAKDTANDVKAYVDERGGLDKVAEEAAAQISKTVGEAARTIMKNVRASARKNPRKQHQGS